MNTENQTPSTAPDTAADSDCGATHCSAFLEIVQYRHDGEDLEFWLDGEHKHLLHDVNVLATAIAEDDRDQDEDLKDPFEWPRKYEIKYRGEWVIVEVSMEYVPHFSPKVLTQNSVLG